MPIIAVIGDYESPKYKTLLQDVKRLKPEEEVLDLSRHKGSWSNQLDKRFTDISNADCVVISADWHKHFDAKRDITHAQSKHKDCFVEREGQFLPFPEHSVA